MRNVLATLNAYKLSSDRYFKGKGGGNLIFQCSFEGGKGGDLNFILDLAQ